MLIPELRLERSALLLLDLQEDILSASGSLGRVGVQETHGDERQILFENIRRLVDEARRGGRPVVYVRTAFRADRKDCFFPPEWMELLKSSTPILVEGSSGAAIPREIAPQEADLIITKKSLCAFQFTHLARLLESFGVETCILGGFCGVAGSIDETARMGGLLGFDSVIAADAVFPVRSPHLQTMTNQAAIKESAEIIEGLRAAGPFKKKDGDVKPAMIIVAMNNDGNHPMGSKYRYNIESHGTPVTQEERQRYIDNNNRLIEAMTLKGFPVIHSQTGVRLDRSDSAHSAQTRRNRGPERARKFPPGVGYMIEGTWGAEILDGVKLPEGYYRAPKKGNSSFGLTYLHRLLKNLGVNVCVVTGDSTTGCVSNTVREAVGLGYKTIVVSDATSRANIPYHKVLANRATVMGTDQVLAFLDKFPALHEPGFAGQRRNVAERPDSGSGEPLSEAGSSVMK